MVGTSTHVQAGIRCGEKEKKKLIFDDKAAIGLTEGSHRGLMRS